MKATEAASAHGPEPAAESQVLLDRLFVLSRSAEVFRLRPQEIQLILDLKNLEQTGLHLLLRRLPAADALERSLIAQILANFSEPRSVDALFELASSDADHKVGAEAARSLALMDGEVAVGRLRQLASQSTSLATFLNAVFGLCRHRVPEGLALANRCLRDKSVSPVWRGTLALSVATLEYPEVLEVISQIIETFPWVPNIMTQVVSCCEAIGTPSALERLAVVAADDRVPDEARLRARAALTSLN